MQKTTKKCIRRWGSYVGLNRHYDLQKGRVFLGISSAPNIVLVGYDA
jgi:hypothetical protein